MTDRLLPTGKLPPDLLAKVIAAAPAADPRVVVGPGTGLDCAVVEAGPDLLVFKSDPITFASQSAGWYAVQVNANDLATTGATPRWFLLTSLLPAGKTTAALVEEISSQVFSACRELGISVIGGHTEITHGLDRPILSGTMIGEVAREKLVTPRGALPGDRLLLTKSVPIEATAILAREFSTRLETVVTEAELKQAQAYLREPGISVVRDAQIATQAGAVHAMHDPTEGGLVTALWEMAAASSCTVTFSPEAVPVSGLSKKICAALGLDPLGAIASGALLIAAAPREAEAICSAENAAGIACRAIGSFEAGEPVVYQAWKGQKRAAARFERDEIARLF